MKRIFRRQWAMLVLLTLFALAGCGGGGGSSPVTVTGACPAWKLNDSMTYLRTETVSGVTTTSTLNQVVTARTVDSATLSDGTTTDSYATAGGQYLPVSSVVAADLANSFGGSTSAYTSATAFCPPPAAGGKYYFDLWIASPVGRGGDYFATVMTVTSSSIESLSVPAGNFTARKIVMARVSAPATALVPDATVSRYLADGIGVVKEVEEMPSTGTTVTKELTAYGFQ